MQPGRQTTLGLRCAWRLECRRTSLLQVAMPPESLQPIEGLSPDLVLELPLGFERTSAFALGPAGPASAADLHAAAAALRIDADVVVNLCENRYLFLAVFAATLARSAPTLLPPSRAVAVIQDIVDAYPGEQGSMTLLRALCSCMGNPHDRLSR